MRRRKNLLAAQSEFEAYQTNVRAELTKREQAVRTREVHLAEVEGGLREGQADLAARGAALDRENSILKRRIAVLAGFSHEMDVPLRAKMSWRDVAAELMAAASPAADEPEMEAVREPVEHTPVNSTLTRTRYQPRARSSRRVEAS